MENTLQRYSVRNLASQSVAKIRGLCDATRLPAGAIIEDAVDMLWDAFEAEDWDQQDEEAKAAPLNAQ